MNDITFSTLFYIITWNLMLKLSKLYTINTLEISRNTKHAEIQWISCVIWNHFPRFGHNIKIDIKLDNLITQKCFQMCVHERF